MARLLHYPPITYRKRPTSHLQQHIIVGYHQKGLSKLPVGSSANTKEGLFNNELGYTPIPYPLSTIHLKHRTFRSSTASYLHAMHSLASESGGTQQNGIAN